MFDNFVKQVNKKYYGSFIYFLKCLFLSYGSSVLFVDVMCVVTTRGVTAAQGGNKPQEVRAVQNVTLF